MTLNYYELEDPTQFDPYNPPAGTMKSVTEDSNHNICLRVVKGKAAEVIFLEQYLTSNILVNSGYQTGYQKFVTLTLGSGDDEMVVTGLPTVSLDADTTYIVSEIVGKMQSGDDKDYRMISVAKSGCTFEYTGLTGTYPTYSYTGVDTLNYLQFWQGNNVSASYQEATCTADGTSMAIQCGMAYVPSTQGDIPLWSVGPGYTEIEDDIPVCVESFATLSGTGVEYKQDPVYIELPSQLKFREIGWYIEDEHYDTVAGLGIYPGETGYTELAKLVQDYLDGVAFGDVIITQGDNSWTLQIDSYSSGVLVLNGFEFAVLSGGEVPGFGYAITDCVYITYAQLDGINAEEEYPVITFYQNANDTDAEYISAITENQDTMVVSQAMNENVFEVCDITRTEGENLTVEFSNDDNSLTCVISYDEGTQTYSLDSLTINRGFENLILN